ncbi:MAG TPA: alpha/beta fold hydrolase [Labilithrix sp.]|nr:alpha/beta fold hydrolase [Labilithrix sp.]
MSIMFKSDDARAVIEGAYERFRATIPGTTSSRIVPTRHGETHVLVAGRADAPPLVLLHGALASSAHATAELGPLLERHCVYAPDVLGQSVKSADARPSLDGPAYAEWLVDVLDGLKLANPIVYGVSWGGFAALKLAAFAPSRIDKLVLLVPAGVVNGSFWQGFTQMVLPLALYRMSPSEARLRRFVGGLLTTLDDDWVTYFGEALRSYNLDIRKPPLFSPESFAEFKRPTLVFGAEQDVSFPGRPLLSRINVLIPHAETELLEGSRHAPPTNDAFRRRMAERITRFVARDLEACAGQYAQ